MSIWGSLTVGAALALVLAGCTTAAPTGTGLPEPEPEPLPSTTGVDYQLGGAYPPASGVGIVARDSTDEPADGLYSICYVNAFQTQPQDAAAWLGERSALLVTDSSGQPLIDENWPDEMILDISTATKRLQLADIIGKTIDTCASSGFDAVEFDNLDSWTRSRGALTVQDSLDFARMIVSTAHARGLSAAQKNSADLGTRGRDQAGFDFAITEECASFDECDAYTGVYGGRVIDIEYTDDLSGDFAEVCADASTPPMTILRDRALETPASGEHVYNAC